MAADILLLNLGIGYGILAGKTQIPADPEKVEMIEPSSLPSEDRCGKECQKYIDDKLSLLDTKYKAEPAGDSGKPSPTMKLIKPTAKPKVRSVQYITIPGSGKTMSAGWEDISGTDFYFDRADYPGLIEVYFEANMSLMNGNGMAYVRLYDVGHGIGIQGSEVQTSNQTPGMVTTGGVTFWAGKNLVRIQAKSLTADTAIYNYGRLKVVTEQ